MNMKIKSSKLESETEKKVMKHLVAAWNTFMELDYQHPQDQPDFCNAIHVCQRILAMRIARKVLPKVYVTHKKRT